MIGQFIIEVSVSNDFIISRKRPGRSSYCIHFTIKQNFGEAEDASPDFFGVCAGELKIEAKY